MKSACLLFGLMLIGGLAFAQKPAAKPAFPRYKIFPETISPDGTLCIGWGDKLAPGINPAALREIPYAEHFEPAEVQDYVIPIWQKQSGAARKPAAQLIPFALPGIRYFSGIDGHEAGRGLSYAWAQDSASLCVLYDSTEKCISALYVDVAAGQSSEIAPAMEAEARRLVRERYSAEQEAVCKNTHFSRIALLPGAILAADIALSAPRVSEDESPTEYSFRIRFRLERRGGEITLAVAQSRLLWPEDFKDDAYSVAEDEVEPLLKSAFMALAQKLDARGRSALETEQRRWLELRSEMANKWNQVGFTRDRIEQLRIRLDE